MQTPGSSLESITGFGSVDMPVGKEDPASYSGRATKKKKSLFAFLYFLVLLIMNIY